MGPDLPCVSCISHNIFFLQIHSTYLESNWPIRVSVGMCVFEILPPGPLGQVSGKLLVTETCIKSSLKFSPKSIHPLNFLALNVMLCVGDTDN